MITKEQIERYCKQNNRHFSELLFATLDRDYQIEDEDYTIPAKTIVQVRLYTEDLADLYVNGECVTTRFPYDAATLLEGK